jgi:hypothetical protein
MLHIAAPTEDAVPKAASLPSDECSSIILQKGTGLTRIIVSVPSKLTIYDRRYDNGIQNPPYLLSQ